MKNRFEIKLLDTENMTEEEWEKFHVFFKQVAKDNYPSFRIEILDDTKNVNGKYHEKWIEEHHQLIDTETDKDVGRIRCGYMDGAKYDCVVWIDILKEYQRQGLSKLLLEKLYIFMEKHERTRAGFWMDNEVQDNISWIENKGAKLDMMLTVSKSYVDDITQEYLDKTTAVIKDDPNLTTELWYNEFPENRMDSYLELDKDFWRTMPQGEEPINRPDTTKEFIMSWLGTLKKKGFDSYMLVAIDKRTEAVISFTHLTVNVLKLDRMHQLGTGTLDGYKKKGIAKALKSMMVELVKEKLPSVEFIFTENAVNNPPMLAINNAMGFKKWFTQRKFNLKKEDLEKFLKR